MSASSFIDLDIVIIGCISYLDISSHLNLCNSSFVPYWFYFSSQWEYMFYKVRWHIVHQLYIPWNMQNGTGNYVKFLWNKNEVELGWIEFNKYSNFLWLWKYCHHKIIIFILYILAKLLKKTFKIFYLL